MAVYHRFFIEKDYLLVKQIIEEKNITITAESQEDILHQMVKVLCLKPGDIIILVIADTSSPFFDYYYHIDAKNKKTALLKFKDKKENNNEPSILIDLVFCLPNKPDKLGFILQKAVELGAHTMTLVEGDHSQFKHGLRLERFHKIIKEAAEQSERAIIPTLSFQGKLLEFLDKHIDEKDNFLVAMERLEEDRKKSYYLLKLLEGYKNHLNKNQLDKTSRFQSHSFKIIFGAEGGFSNEEKNFIQKNNFQCFSLGKRILRMETAIIATLTAINLTFEV